MPRDIPITQLRNIGIMAHIDAGKTTCAERILYCAGRIHKTGEVHEGTAVLDFDPIEQKRGITINAAATSVAWTPSSGLCPGQAHRIQIVDTPGHVDFTIEVERSLRVLDGAVFVLDAASGVECQSETVFHQAERHGVPSLAFVNKIDKPGADFDMCLRDIRERLGIEPVALHVPLSGSELLDVVHGVVLGFDGRAVLVSEMTAAHRTVFDAARATMMETLASFDEDVLALFCQGGNADARTLARAIRTGALKRKVLPVACGSALKNVGIPSLLDAIVDYLPSPVDVPDVSGTHPLHGTPLTRRADEREPFAALAFKTVFDRAGYLTYVRIYSGALSTGDGVRLGRSGARERVGRLFRPHADQREEVRTAFAGDIVAVTGLRDVRTGETLCASDEPIVLERIDTPAPVVEVTIEPKTADDRERLPTALGRMLFQDPSLLAWVDPESGEMRLAGMGSLHLDVTVTRLREDHRVAVSMGRPEVAYRETIAHAARVAYRHAKQHGGAGQFAGVTLAVAPGARGSGITFSDETVGGCIPREYVPAVEKGVRAAASRGIVAGYPVVDVAVTLLDGETHVKDSNAAAFEFAGSLAFQKACTEGGAILLEPYAALEIAVPELHAGDVIGDLGARRGLVQRLVPRGRNAVVVSARLPLAETFDYVTRLRGFTQGRGTASMRPDGYEVAPSTRCAEGGPKRTREGHRTP
ncbi:elongation factor G [Pendulispora brunnea]